MSENDFIKVMSAGKQEPALPYLNVYRWTTKLSTEQEESMEYIWSAEVKSLLRRLTYTQGNNVAVIGLQGSGKTATRNELQFALESSSRNTQSKKKTISIKWSIPKTIEKTLRESANYDLETYLLILHGPLREKLQVDQVREGYGIPQALDTYMINTTLTENETIAVRKWIFHFNDEKIIRTVTIAIPKLEKILGRRKTSELRREAAKYQTQNLGNILIDFPDYDKKSRGQMRKDLKDFGEWWEQICNVDNEYAQQPNIVIFWQEELWGDHFTFGKWDIVRLRRLRSGWQ